MELRTLSIERKTYGELAGKYIATVRIGDEKGTISMEISPRISNIILHACVDELSAATELAANTFRDNLRASVSHTPRLTHEKP